MSRCLQKDPNKRLQHIDGARILIEEALTGETTASAIGLTVAEQPGRWRQTITLGVVALVGIGIGGMAIWSLLPSTPFPQQSLNKFVVSPSPTASLTELPGNEVAISSDGKRIIYVAESEGIAQLYVRFLDEFEATPIPGTEGTTTNPFFSPDGESVGFVAPSRQLKRVPLVGGSPITLCDIEGDWQGGSWFEDTIVFGMGGFPGGSLYRLSAAGGEPELLVTPDPDRRETYRNPHILPGGKAVLFNIDGPEENDNQIAVLSLETGEQKVLLQQGYRPYYAPTGHVVYGLPETETLMAIAFDLGRLEVTGDPVPVLEGIRPYGNNPSDFALSESGAFIYVPTLEYRYSPVWVDREGTETRVSQQTREYARPRISPDGKQILFTLRTTGRPGRAAIYDLERGSFSLLAFKEAEISGPIWSPDSKWITFGSNLGGEQNIYRQLADRTAVPEQLIPLSGERVVNPSSWSPDGRVLTYTRATANAFVWDIFVLNREENEEPQPLIVSPDNHACCAVFSPDGKWLAYVAGERGSTQVYVRPYPGPDIKFLVSEEAEGGGEPAWSPDGRELFYRRGNRMIAVSVQTEPTFRKGKSEVLFEGIYRSTPIPAGLQYYDISPDGQRFLMIKREQAPTQINVVLNWLEELKRLVPTN
jgi:Tol biopolymer transport system component